MREELKPILAELRRELEALYGDRLVQLILYGSQARGDADPESDIDVLVVLKGPVDSSAEIERTGCFTASLSLKYDVVISRVFVAQERYQEEQNSFLFNVRKEGVPI
jgi:predicted nucleotidyltransferase